MGASSYTLPNLLQGVSQQSPEERRATQCEAEQNCINSSKEGVVARQGADLDAFLASADYTNAAFYEIFRGDAEHYLAIIPNSAASGDIVVYDLIAHAMCTVTKDGSQTAYLATGSALARDSMRFQTVDDYTFIANRTKTVAFTGTVQTTRPHEALIFVKAGVYLTNYTVAVTYNGHVYTFTYQTPDNSVAGNAAYINSSMIAATLYKAMQGAPATVYTSGDVPAADRPGVGAMWPGAATAGAITAPITITSLGFTLQIRGNVILLTGPVSDGDGDDEDFTIDCGEGNGNTFMIALKDKVQSLADLPQKGFLGVRFQVSGVDKKADNAYYIEYTANDTWQECAGAGIKTTLDKATMPHALINTGYQLFTFGAVDWSTRVAGDDTTAQAPYFVGNVVQDLFFLDNRLGILSEAAYDLSKARNQFCFVPDTVQTALGTAPISNPLQGGKSISLMRRAVSIDESVYLWAQLAQFRVAHDNLPLRTDTVSTKIATAYRFAEAVQPIPIAHDLYFVVEPDSFASLKTISFNPYLGARAAPAVDLTAHVPTYIAAGVRDITHDETLGMMFLRSDGLPSGLYHYGFIVQGSEVVQSAWQTWQFPASTILWASISGAKLLLAMQRTGGVAIVSVPLTRGVLDPGGNYHTRLDLKVAESGVSALSYNATLNQTTMTIPYVLAAGERDNMRLVIRTTSANFIRGATLQVLFTMGDATTTIRVAGDVHLEQFYVGFVVDSYMDLSEFFPRAPDGSALFYDDVTVERLHVSHAHTSYYTVTLTFENGTTKTTEWTSQRVGVAGGATGVLDPAKGKVDVPVQHKTTTYTARLRNNSPFPSAWQRVRVDYTYVTRANPDRGT